MRKAPLYSRSPRQAAAPPSVAPTASPGTDEAIPTAAADAASPPVRTGPRRRERLAWATVAVLLVAVGVTAGQLWRPTARAMTAQQIDAAMRQSLEEKPLPSVYARAHAAIAPSIVRVDGEDALEEAPAADKSGKSGKRPERSARDKAPQDKSDGSEPEMPGPGGKHATGTGVVIVDNGTILTNLHVVAGSKRLKVTFADGSESEASIVGVQPEHDLAVLRARTVPDDLQAATMRSTSDLEPGDQVIAVGFPFGIGPSVSGGVVSGLRREFRSPQGQRKLTNLIQFDAAANPGNSGGPLVTMDGAVVGIVTAILNPSEARTFIGIGFAVPIENAAAAAGMPPF